MSQEKIKTIYSEIEIEYVETDNKWTFTVNGRQRSTDTLMKAKESIDRSMDEVKTKKVKAWQPFQAYKKGSYNEPLFVTVTVTSMGEPNRYNKGATFWTSKDGKREKTDADQLFSICPENDTLIKEISALDKQIESLKKIEESKRDNLQRLTEPLP